MRKADVVKSPLVLYNEPFLMINNLGFDQHLKDRHNSYTAKTYILQK